MAAKDEDPYVPRTRTKFLESVSKTPLILPPCEQGWGTAEPSRIPFTLPDRIALRLPPKFSKDPLGQGFAAGQKGGGR